MKAIRKIIAALVALLACMSYTFALADNVNTNYSDSAYQTVSTVADSGKCGDNLKWVLDTNGTITISGTGEMSEYAFQTSQHQFTAEENEQYMQELESLLNEDKYRKIKAFRLHVADMEDGNTSLSSSGVNAKTVYEKELDYNSTKAYTQYLGYDGKDFLDKSGNIINPNIFSEYFFYFESKALIQISLITGVLSLVSYFILKFKTSLTKNSSI